MEKRRLLRQQGSALLVVLIFGMILCLMVGSYLLLVQQQNKSVNRSLSWNAGMAIAEAGIEEALVQLHYTGVTNLSANAWTLSNGQYTKQHYIGTSYYIVGITTVDPPVITSAAYVPLPFAVVNTPVYIRRTVQVKTARDGAFMKAMLAKKQIDFNGNNIMTDSFDSSDPNYSQGGRYVKTRAKDNGDVATNLGLINSLNVGNANIYGHVATGPHGTVAVGSQGAVGDSAWQTGGATGIEPGWFTDDMNVQFPDVQIPYTSGWTPQTGKYQGTTYTYLLGDGNYIMGDLSMQNSEVLFVSGNANLYITNSIQITGNAQIEIGSKGSLVIYMGGQTASFGGNEIVNGTGYAINFIYLGLPTNTDLRFVGNADFTGAIYAPSADFQLGGGGLSPYDFVGASVSNTVTMNGHFKFHYDEALGKSRWSRGYVITSWDEI